VNHHIRAAAMASLQVLLDRALATMAVGSQRDNRTVRAVASPFSEYVLRLSNQMGVLSAAALPLSSVRDLLHVAGWLYPCRMPSSPLSSDIKQDAVVAWNMCMVWATNFLSFNQCMSLAPFQLLVEARSRPRVPGGRVILMRQLQTFKKSCTCLPTGVGALFQAWCYLLHANAALPCTGWQASTQTRRSWHDQYACLHAYHCHGCPRGTSGTARSVVERR
jgi:hypothetical protein